MELASLNIVTECSLVDSIVVVSKSSGGKILSFRSFIYRQKGDRYGVPHHHYKQWWCWGELDRACTEDNNTSKMHDLEALCRWGLGGESRSGLVPPPPSLKDELGIKKKTLCSFQPTWWSAFLSKANRHNFRGTFGSGAATTATGEAMGIESRLGCCFKDSVWMAVRMTLIARLLWIGPSIKGELNPLDSKWLQSYTLSGWLSIWMLVWFSSWLDWPRILRWWWIGLAIKG